MSITTAQYNRLFVFVLRVAGKTRFSRTEREQKTLDAFNSGVALEKCFEMFEAPEPL